MRLVFVHIDYIIDNLVKQPVKHFRWRIQIHRASITWVISQNSNVADVL